MASSQRYGTHSGRGGSIAVAAIATLGGVAALFAYHTSPGHAADPMAEDTMNAAPVAAGEANGDTGMASGAEQGTAVQKAEQGTAVQKKATTRAKGAAGTGKMTKTGGTHSTVKTFAGAPANTRWGTVQVQITVKNGKITSAKTLQRPDSSQRSIQINQKAVPILNKETVKAGTAKIDSVSGATVTSGGYRQSLQSAVDKAHL